MATNVITDKRNNSKKVISDKRHRANGATWALVPDHYNPGQMVGSVVGAVISRQFVQNLGKFAIKSNKEKRYQNPLISWPGTVLKKKSINQKIMKLDKINNVKTKTSVALVGGLPETWINESSDEGGRRTLYSRVLKIREGKFSFPSRGGGGGGGGEGRGGRFAKQTV